MRVIRSAAQLRDERARAAEPVGFVPTMGYLHAGHTSLIDLARAADASVFVSIFVNPLQFGPTEDLAAYPRDEDQDLEMCERHGVDAVFLPDVDEMYPAGRTTTVHVGGPDAVLEGAARPGHFDGVATVVSKLFNLVRPQRAYFGQKDAQQVAVIKRMVADLSMPVEIVVGPTVREASGLALSSRNSYLDDGQRSQAAALFEALNLGARALRTSRDPELAAKTMAEHLEGAPGVAMEYARVVDPDTFGPPSGRRMLLVVAARVGPARLIDNLPVELEA